MAAASLWFPLLAVSADGDVTLTVTPSTATFGADPVALVVALENGSGAKITDASLSWLVNGEAALTTTPGGDETRTASPGTVLVWDVVVTSGGTSVATITFRVAYRSQNQTAGAATPAPVVERVAIAEFSIAAAAAPVTMAIEPSEIELSELKSRVMTLVVTNTSTRSLTVTIDAPDDDSIEVSPPSQTGQVEGGDAVAFPFTLTALSRLSAGDHALTFSTTTTQGDSLPRRSTVTTTVALSTQALATITVDGGAGELSEQSPMRLTVLVTNTSGASITVTITPRADPLICFSSDQTSVQDLGPTGSPEPVATNPGSAPGSCSAHATVTIPSGDQAGVAFTLEASRRVLSGARSVIFDASVKSGAETRHLVVTHPVTLSVLGADLLETPLGIPAFYLIPGVIIAVVWGWIWKLWGPLFTSNLSLTAFDKEFWILAIGVSFLFSGLYGLVNRILFQEPVDLIGSTGYGTVDVIRVWFLAIAVPIVIYVAARLIQDWLRRDQINPRDRPLDVLRKMGAIPPDRPRVSSDGARGYLATDDLQSGGFWVVPPIEVEWFPSAPLVRRQAVDAELTAAGSLAAIQAELAAADQAGQASVRFRKSGTFVRPRKLPPENLSLGERDFVVSVV